MLQNKYRIVGDVAYISLTKGQETMIDVEDLERVLSCSWHAKANEMGGYYATTGKGVHQYLHRFILDAPNGIYVDHGDHNTLNNRRYNLKLCTNQENNVNRNGAFSTSKTGIRGVSTHQSKNAWGTVYYVFRCHCVTCKACKYFPYTEEGLAQAKAFAEAHYAAMNK